MQSIFQPLTRHLLTGLVMGLLGASLAACGGGAGGGGQTSSASGPQGLRFAIDKSYTEMVYSVDAKGPNGTTKYTLGLSPGQEMFESMPTGTYQLTFWIHVGGGMSVMDFTPRTATVQPSQVTEVRYP